MSSVGVDDLILMLSVMQQLTSFKVADDTDLLKGSAQPFEYHAGQLLRCTTWLKRTAPLLVAGVGRRELLDGAVEDRDCDGKPDGVLRGGESPD